VNSGLFDRSSKKNFGTRPEGQKFKGETAHDPALSTCHEVITTSVLDLLLKERKQSTTHTAHTLAYAQKGFAYFTLPVSLLVFPQVVMA